MGTDISLINDAAWLTAERSGPGRMSVVTSSLVLAGVSRLQGLAVWSAQSATSLFGRLRSSLAFPVTVQLSSGCKVTLHVVREAQSDLPAVVYGPRSALSGLRVHQHSFRLE